jgi:hypothetical protein
MEFSDQDKQVLQLSVEQIWRKGCNNPGEASLAQALTDLVKRVLTQQPAKEPEKKV